MKLNKYRDLEEAVDGLRNRGFSYNLKLSNSNVTCLSTGEQYEPEQLQIVEYHRFESESETATSSIVFAIQCDDGVSGILIHHYRDNISLKMILFMSNVKIQSGKRVA